MAHRMSPSPTGYAENSLQTLQYTYSIAPCVIQEMDIRMSKDSVLLMMHDATLDRTTTGKGKINEMPYNELKQLLLKDEAGNVLTNQHIPQLQEILQFAKGKMILALDMKPGTDPGRLMKTVMDTHTLTDVFVICYSIADAVKLNKKYPTLVMALGFNNWDNIAAIEQSGIPFQNLVALTPTVLQEKAFYDKIHSMGIMTSISTFGKIDQYPADSAIATYKEAWNKGGDIICTDSLQTVRQLFR